MHSTKPTSERTRLILRTVRAQHAMMRLAVERVQADRLIALTEAENARLRQAVNEVRDLIRESTGVAGLHRNGDVADWESLLPGGQFEGWLTTFGEIAGL